MMPDKKCQEYSCTYRTACYDWLASLVATGKPMNDTIGSGVSADESLSWLHGEGWLLGHSTADGEYKVTGFKCNQWIQGAGSTLEKALEQICEQARLKGVITGSHSHPCCH